MPAGGVPVPGHEVQPDPLRHKASQQLQGVVLIPGQDVDPEGAVAGHRPQVGFKAKPPLSQGRTPSHTLQSDFHALKRRKAGS